MQSTHELKGTRARRLARDAEESKAAAEVREVLALNRASAAEERAADLERRLGLCRDELHGATVAGQRAAEALAEAETVAGHLAEMLREVIAAGERNSEVIADALAPHLARAFGNEPPEAPAVAASKEK